MEGGGGEGHSDNWTLQMSSVSNSLDLRMFSVQRAHLSAHNTIRTPEKE